MERNAKLAFADVLGAGGGEVLLDAGDVECFRARRLVITDFGPRERGRVAAVIDAAREVAGRVVAATAAAAFAFAAAAAAAVAAAALRPGLLGVTVGLLRVAQLLGLLLPFALAAAAAGS